MSPSFMVVVVLSGTCIPNLSILSRSDEAGVSGRVPEIQIPVRKRGSPDFKVTRQARTGYSVNTSAVVAGGDMRDWLWCQARG
ncbi:uncharacterized protein MEPE_06485 [Melanopsichium pennsylvanicum]|uniref:Uncharacterized protein n=1 Tax=Melanopsichium pennsylvanicum TaxID=63383 RepID=A0AAJ4XR87_9BASI|nr:uncharacterized protein MEPE_06485 [Melanopsichium pennsylvanicum]